MQAFGSDISKPWWIACGSELMREAKEGNKIERTVLIFCWSANSWHTLSLTTCSCSEHNLLWASPLCSAFTNDNSTQYKQARENISALYASPPSAGMHMQSQPAHMSHCNASSFEWYSSLMNHTLMVHMYQGERWDSTVIGKISTALYVSSNTCT